MDHQSESPSPDDEELRRIADALATMDPRERAVFDRVRYQSLTYRAIAAELGLTERRVERAFARALLHLVRCVDGHGGP